MEIPDKSWIEIIVGQEALLEGFKEMKKKFDGLHDDLHEPDDGIFTRVRKNTEFRKLAKKALWIMAAAIVGITSRMIADFIMGK